MAAQEKIVRLEQHNDYLEKLAEALHESLGRINGEVRGLLRDNEDLSCTIRTLEDRVAALEGQRELAKRAREEQNRVVILINGHHCSGGETKSAAAATNDGGKETEAEEEG